MIRLWLEIYRPILATVFHRVKLLLAELAFLNRRWPVKLWIAFAAAVRDQNTGMLLRLPSDSERSIEHALKAWN